MNVHELLATLDGLAVRLTVEGERLRFRAAKGVLTPELRDSLVAQKAAVVAELRARRRATRTTRPLSASQRSLWILDRQHPESAAYNVCFAVRVTSVVNEDALTHAIRALVDRHAVLRTRYFDQDGVAWQEELGELGVPLERVRAEEWDETLLKASVVAAARRPFDLSAGPVLRVTLFSHGPLDQVLLLVVHHIAADAWSLMMLLEQLGQLYAEHVGGAAAPLASEGSYADYVQWQEASLAGAEGQRLWAHWRDALAGAPASINLRPDRSDAGADDPADGGTVSFRVDADLSASLRDTAGREKVTLYALMLTAFGVLLHRCTGDEDLLVATPAFGRSRPEFEQMIGDFVNTVPVRLRIGGDEAFATVLQRTRLAAMEALANQELPFPLLVERLRPAREPGRMPLVQVLFGLLRFDRFSEIGSLLLDDAGAEPVSLGGLALRPYPIPQQEGQFELAMQVSDRPGAPLAGALRYDGRLFDRSTAERLLERFVALLRAVVAAPQTVVGALPMLGAGERRLLLEKFAGGTASFPVTHCIHERVRSRAATTPDAVAVSCEGRSLSYRELDERANRLAHYLTARGVGPEVLVGMYVERSLEMVVAMLAILKAGGGYVPLDPAYPADRVAFMLGDAKVPVLLTQRSMLDRLPMHDAEVLLLDESDAALAVHPTTPPQSAVRPDNVAYVIYTSGSTGTPKGVVVTHANVVRLFDATDHWYGFGPDDVWTLFHSYAFDFSVWELWGALFYGGRLVVVPQMVSRSPEDFYRLLAREGVTVLNQTPSAFAQLVQHETTVEPLPLALRYVIFGGEALDVRTLAPWFERHAETRPRLVNMYGITETTVHVTYQPVTAADAALGRPASLVGRPIPDLTVYLLDPRGEPVPIGVPGEMYVGGGGVARGYLARSELTAQRFVPDAFRPGEGATLYRSGDLARWLPDGTLEYLGRIDHQVKIRGFRIELGEIEAVLGKIAGVGQCAVLVREDTPGDRRLVAYLAPAASAPPMPGDAAVRERLRAALPDYMVPAAFVRLDRFPLTENGKLDRRALPSPAAGGLEPRSDGLLITPTQTAIADIWREVLGIPRVGRHDDFFALGGHSLLATQVISRIRAVFHVPLPLSVVFECTTLEGLAARVDAAADANERPAVPPLRRRMEVGPAPLSSSQQRMWLVQELSPESIAYNIPLALRLRGTLDVASMESALDTIVARHEILRSTYRLDGDEVVQEVTSASPETLGVVQAGSLADALELAGETAREPFDLARGPVLRRVLYRIAPDDHLLLLCLHHIASDAWSLGIICRELAIVYNARIAATDPTLLPVTVRYRDFARWQRESLEGDQLDGQLAYWRHRLHGLEAIDLPTDRPRPPVISLEGAHHLEPLPPALLARLRLLATREGSTVFTAAAAAFAVLLRRWSGQDDFALAVPVANRTIVEMEALVGTCINMLVLRVDASGNPTFRELLRRVHGSALEAFAHQDLPFERLVEDPAFVRDPSRAPLAQVMFNVQNVPLGDLRFTGLSMDVEQPERRGTQFELGLFMEMELTRSLLIEYSSSLYDAPTIARLARQFLCVLDAACAEPDTPIATMGLLPDDERHLVLDGWNATTADYPHDTVTSRLVEAQVARTPDAPAVTVEGETLSYAALDARANRLARHLRASGAGRGTVVGVFLPRSSDLVPVLLAVQKVGAAYLPLDPLFPADRIAYMLSDSGASLLVTEPETGDGLELPVGVRVVDLVRDADVIATRETARIADAARPDDPAYLIYTSGSTGRPKGVVVSHDALVNFLWSMRREPGLTGDDVVAAVTTISFDIAALELYLPLLVGAHVLLVARDVAVDGERLAQLLAGRGVSMMQATPATWRLLLECEWRGAPGFRALSGGERLPPDLAESLLARVHELWNLYGPTETTVWSTVVRVETGTPITIGRPIANTRVYVLDLARQPVPVGVPGELWIGGTGVAVGYHARPELTAERFVADPFAPAGARSPRMYRTGDRARWRADGTLEHLGRLDHQVKVRGYRIELGEIESVLAAHPAVRQAVVMARDVGDGDLRLVAYLVYVAGEDLSVSEVRRLLRRQLPDYMIPSMFVTLDALPLTPNAKVDRKALPDPFRGAAGSVALPRTPPAPGLETLLAEVWRDMLQIDTIGAEDNFFELGGHSLLALRVAAAVHARTGWRMDPRLLFFQHIRQIAAAAPITIAHPEPTPA